MNTPKLRFKEFNDESYRKDILKNIISYIADNRGKNPDYYLDSGIPVIDNFMIQNQGYPDLSRANRYIDDNIYENFIRKEIEYNDTLITLVGNGIGNICLTPKEKCVIIQNTLGLRTNKFNDKKYLYHLLTYKNSEIKKLDRGMAQPSIRQDELLKLEVTIPNINEQLKISNFLSLLDKKIELQSKKIEDLKLFKLYTKNQIFNDYDEVFKLKDILVKWNKKNKNNSVKYVESISNKYGFISQSDQFEDRNVASKNLNNYYIIEKGVFGYNPSRLNVGSLALKTNDKISVVSPLYECFTTSQNNQYLLEWFDSKFFRKETISKFEGGVRNTLNFSNLCEIEIRLPIIEKQNKYSNIFSMFNNKIELEEKKLYKLQELKKGLMQNMFV